MAERKYCKMKKDIHPEYRPVVFMDTTTGYKFLSGSTKRSNETVEFEGENLPIDPCGNFIRLTPILHWTSKVHSSRWTRGSFQQKNTVSNKQLLVVKPFRLEWFFLYALGYKLSYSHLYKIKKTASIWKPFNPINLLYQ